MAIRIPAMKFPSVCCDASPMITPRMAVEASRAPATARTCGITSRAEKRPTTMMIVVMARRRTRYRVSTSGGTGLRDSHQSTSCATTQTSTKTAAAMTMRCQKGIVARFAAGAAFPQRFLVEGQRPAARETVVLAVPPRDLVLAELPAEEHRLAVVQRREVHETAVEVLHLGAVLGDLVDEACQAPRDGVDLGSRLSELGGRDSASVAADLSLELLLTLERGRVLQPSRH